MSGAEKNLAARLRQRITLQARQLNAQGDGGYSENWTDVISVWAEVVPVERRVASVEGVTQERLVSTPVYRITLRYREGITSDMRAVYDGRYFNIRSVICPNEANVVLQLLAEEHTAT